LPRPRAPQGVGLSKLRSIPPAATGGSAARCAERLRLSVAAAPDQPPPRWLEGSAFQLARRVEGGGFCRKARGFPHIRRRSRVGPSNGSLIWTAVPRGAPTHGAKCLLRKQAFATLQCRAGSADHRLCGPRPFGPVMEGSDSCARIGGARPNRAKSGSVNLPRRLSRRTTIEKYRSERKGGRSLDTALEYGTAAMIASEETRTAESAVRATCSKKLAKKTRIYGFAMQRYPPAGGFLCGRWSGRKTQAVRQKGCSARARLKIAPCASFPRKRESTPFLATWTPAYAGVTR
jgi:hypothetical protein